MRASATEPNQDIQAARGNRCVEHGLDLRGNAKAVNIPIGTQMADETASLGNRQRLPEIVSLCPHLIDHAMPAYALSLRRFYGSADRCQQRYGGMGGIGDEIAEERLRHRRMPARPQAAARDRGHRAVMPAVSKRGNDIGSRQAIADDQHPVMRADHVERARLGGIGDETGMGSKPGRKPGAAARRMAGGDRDDIGLRHAASVVEDRPTA